MPRLQTNLRKNLDGTLGEIPTAVGLSKSTVHRLDILSITRPYLEKLSNITWEAVHLVVRDGNDIVYIFNEDSGNNSVRMSSRIDLRSPPILHRCWDHPENSQ